MEKDEEKQATPAFAQRELLVDNEQSLEEAKEKITFYRKPIKFLKDHRENQ